MPWKIVLIAGARPNFMKVAPLLRVLGADQRFSPRLVHTGQHYDARLSQVFFEELGLPRPDVELEVGSGSHAMQTAEVMKRFEVVLEREQPHGVLVVGDVNSTVGCALVASKFILDSPFHTSQEARTRPLVIHVESGLRSGDRDMPEETNRVVTDALSDLLFVSEPAGMANLAREGVATQNTFLVGNVMIDTMVAARSQAMASTILTSLGLQDLGYGLVTLHRPSNVDSIDSLRSLVATLSHIARDLPLVFPVHPRTSARIAQSGVALPGWLVTEPLGYLDFVRLMSSARVVFTDSGGVQEETTVLGVPCITLRSNTERPITCTEGTNQLVGTDPAAILRAYSRIDDVRRQARVPALWDGSAAVRIVEHLSQILR